MRRGHLGEISTFRNRPRVGEQELQGINIRHPQNRSPGILTNQILRLASFEILPDVQFQTIFQNVLCEDREISWPKCSIFYTPNQDNLKLISLKTQDNLVKSSSSLSIIFKE